MLGGKEITIPLDIFCYLCGTTAEVWPLESSAAVGRQSLAEKYHNLASFREQFVLARAAAEKMQSRAFRFQEVHADKMCGMHVKVVACLVPESFFCGKRQVKRTAYSICRAGRGYHPSLRAW